MRGDRLRGLVLAAVLLAFVLPGCAPGPPPVRLGVLADCMGLARGTQDEVLAAAELPLLQRGARLRGTRPADGVTAATVAGRPVELVTACTEGGEYSTLIEQARRLVEVDKADVVVGGTWPGDGLVLRETARRYPSTAFVVALPGPREVTLGAPPANVFRFAADFSQQAAGLGTYAFRDLGWRDALVLVEDTEPGWGGDAAFVAEFCELGGHVRQELVPLLGREGYVPPPRPAAGGVVVIASPLGIPAEWLLGPAGPAPASTLLLGPGFGGDPEALAALPAELRGVVTAGPAREPEVARRYAADFLRNVPGSTEARALQPYPVAYRDAVEAVLVALESGGPLLAALAGVRPDLVTGAVHLDADRAAVVSTALVPVGSGEPVRTVTEVDQTIGGLLDESYEPVSGEQPCRAATPPPWAR
jgi:branched-chain amino acid transport system substrate-binding protein